MNIRFQNNQAFCDPAPEKRDGWSNGKSTDSPIPSQAFLGKDTMGPSDLMARPGQMMQQSTAQQFQQGAVQQDMTRQGPPTMTEPYYIPNYLARNLGKNVRAEFVIGTSQFMDKSGILREVGVNYFVLEDYISHALIMCDLYSVKFVTIL
ncbi:MAG: hypothetical protein PHT34_03880 [Oscillospiraceae bacterium]|nr:hypothetical protein [Oscillospiraceae bacterium]